MEHLLLGFSTSHGIVSKFVQAVSGFQQSRQLLHYGTGQADCEELLPREEDKNTFVNDILH